MNILDQYFRKHNYAAPVPAIKCKDGFNFSVQASRWTYCSPKVSSAYHYDKVEVGFPSAKEETLMPYVEDVDRPLDTVYGYVPVEIVIAIINSHGGMVDG